MLEQKEIGNKPVKFKIICFIFKNWNKKYRKLSLSGSFLVGRAAHASVFLNKVPFALLTLTHITSPSNSEVSRRF